MCTTRNQVKNKLLRQSIISKENESVQAVVSLHLKVDEFGDNYFHSGLATYMIGYGSEKHLDELILPLKKKD